MGGDDHVGGLREFLDHPAEDASLRGVEARRRLVQEDQAGRVDQRLCHADAPKLPARQRRGRLIGLSGEPHPVQRPDGRVPRLAPRHALEPSGVRDLFAARHAGDGGDVLGHPADPAPVDAQLSAYRRVESGEGDGAGTGLQHGGGQGQERGLAGPVRAQEHRPPRGEAEAEPVEDDGAPPVPVGAGGERDGHSLTAFSRSRRGRAPPGLRHGRRGPRRRRRHTQTDDHPDRRSAPRIPETRREGDRNPRRPLLAGGRAPWTAPPGEAGDR